MVSIAEAPQAHTQTQLPHFSSLTVQALIPPFSHFFLPVFPDYCSSRRRFLFAGRTRDAWAGSSSSSGGCHYWREMP